MKDLKMEEFLELLASSSLVPGEGAASALVGATGVSLACMVGNLTKGKKKFESVQEKIHLLVEKGDRLRAIFLELMEQDERGFELLAKAYSLPKETEKEKNSGRGFLRKR